MFPGKARGGLEGSPRKVWFDPVKLTLKGCDRLQRVAPKQLPIPRSAASKRFVSWSLDTRDLPPRSLIAPREHLAINQPSPPEHYRSNKQFCLLLAG